MFDSSWGARFREREVSVVRFGRATDLPAGALRAAPEPADSKRTFAIRATDPLAMRLVYAVDPFFQAIEPAGQSWSLR